MTLRQMIAVSAEEISEMAFNGAGDIEIDTAESRAYLRVGATTYVAELSEPTC